MAKEYEFKGQAYLEKSWLDKDGAKHITFEFSGNQAIEIAKLELMGRDLEKHLPVLLEITVKQSLIKGLPNARQKKQTQVIR